MKEEPEQQSGVSPDGDLEEFINGHMSPSEGENTDSDREIEIQDSQVFDEEAESEDSEDDVRARRAAGQPRFRTSSPELRRRMAG